MLSAPIMFPVAERVGKQIVSLPMFYAMNEVDVERVCAACAKCWQ